MPWGPRVPTQSKDQALNRSIGVQGPLPSLYPARPLETQSRRGHKAGPWRQGHPDPPLTLLSLQVPLVKRASRDPTVTRG